MTPRTWPDPSINLETAPFWAAAREGKLLLKRCATCEKVHYYPRAICPHCFSDDTRWIEASGIGTIYSYSVMRRASVPYVLAYVILAEGVTMLSNLVDCGLDEIRVGQAVELVYRATEGGEALAVFRLAKHPKEHAR